MAPLQAATGWWQPWHCYGSNCMRRLGCSTETAKLCTPPVRVGRRNEHAVLPSRTLASGNYLSPSSRVSIVAALTRTCSEAGSSRRADYNELHSKVNSLGPATVSAQQLHKAPGGLAKVLRGGCAGIYLFEVLSSGYQWVANKSTPHHLSQVSLRACPATKDTTN